MPHFITQIVSCSIDRDRLLSAEASEVLSLMGCIITTLPFSLLILFLIKSEGKR